MITQEIVRELFIYHPGNGSFKNRAYNGPRALKNEDAGSLTVHGYRSVSISGKRYTVHRLIYLYVYGHIPEFIDHINGVRSDNKIKNLRQCTHPENRRNAKINKNNRSGIKGVSWCKTQKSWVARLMTDGKVSILGRFWDKEVAAQVVRIERGRLHGEFANNG